MAIWSLFQCNFRLFGVRLARNRRGGSLVEFALVLPVLGFIMFGVLGYGQYFLIAHSLQMLANDAARATVAGLNSSERTTLAQQSVAAELPALSELTASRVTTQTSEAGNFVTVTVSYDAGNISIFRTNLIPMPDPVIQRRAVARPGGIA